MPSPISKFHSNSRGLEMQGQRHEYQAGFTVFVSVTYSSAHSINVSSVERFHGKSLAQSIHWRLICLLCSRSLAVFQLSNIRTQLVSCNKLYSASTFIYSGEWILVLHFILCVNSELLEVLLNHSKLLLTKYSYLCSLPMISCYWNAHLVYKRKAILQVSPMHISYNDSFMIDVGLRDVLPKVHEKIPFCSFSWFLLPLHPPGVITYFLGEVRSYTE